MVQGKKASETMNGSKYQSGGMSVPNKDGSNSRGGNMNRNEGRSSNGNSSTFRTDTAISGKKMTGERTLQRWQPDSPADTDGALEGPTSKSSAPWDQFAENNRRFGLTTDYDENIYTTTIDKAHPQYQQRRAAAMKMEAEILSGTTNSAHVAEERVTDHHTSKGTGADEEDKYSGVRRQADFPPLSSSASSNKYTPPARRAPTGQSTVPGAPVDPAIITSQLARTDKPSVSEKNKPASTSKASNAVGPSTTDQPSSTLVPEAKPNTVAATSTFVSRAAADKSKIDSTLHTSKTSAATNPNATATVERDVADSFKEFAAQQRKLAEQMRRDKHKADKEDKLKDLRKFADSFKLHTPVPKDLVSIIAKDPAKQKEIQEKAKRNAEEAKVSSTETGKAQNPTGEAKANQARQQQASNTQSSTPSTMANRHNLPNGRNGYQQQISHGGRGQSSANNMGRSNNSGARMRGPEQRQNGPPNGLQIIDPYRMPPTGPSGINDPNFSRRPSGVNGAQAGRLNPHSSEFRPNASASSFVPTMNPSSTSSPRLSNPADKRASPPTDRSFLRRKILSESDRPSLKGKFNALESIKSLKVPQGKNWDANGGMKPAYETPPAWRSIVENEPAESTMHYTYDKLFELAPYISNMSPQILPAIPPLPHAHQLPFHLQHGMHNVGMRQSPRQMPMNLHGGGHGHPHSANLNGPDDHRMMHSNSTQSFTSPRTANVMSFPSPMHQSAQLTYNGPMMHYNGAPPMGAYRSMSQSQNFMPQQGHMGPMMMNNVNGFMGPQGGQGHFIPPNGGHPAGMPMNGFPSPGRGAPMMMSQGSQQGHQQAMYGMSPGLQYGNMAPVYIQPNQNQGRNGMPQ